MIGISEGAFETFHQDYRLFDVNFKNPRPLKGGEEEEKQTTTSSGETRKRNREQREKKSDF